MLKTWEDYKAHVKAQGPEEKENMEQIEKLSNQIVEIMANSEMLKKIKARKP